MSLIHVGLPQSLLWNSNALKKDKVSINSGIFFFDEKESENSSINPCPAEPRYALPLQTV